MADDELTKYKRLVRGMIENDDRCQSPFCGVTMMGHLIIPLGDELVDLVRSQDKDQPEYEGDLDDQ